MSTLSTQTNLPMLSTPSGSISVSTNRKSRRVPAELRQRTENSCDRCKTRKHKCRRTADSERCYHCSKYGYECVVSKPRKPRLPPTAAAAAAASAAAGVLVDAYSARMEAMEELIKGLVPEADVTSLESLYRIGQGLGIPLTKSEGASLLTEDTSPSKDGKTTQADERLVDTPLATRTYASPPPLSPSLTATSTSAGDEALVHDRQGQRQYIGQASSYYFQIHLQTLVGAGHRANAGHMQLFGPNPVDKKELLLRQHNACPSSTCAIRDESTSQEVVELEPVHSHISSNNGRRLSAGRHGAVQPAATVAALAGMDLLSGSQATEVLSTVHAFFEHVDADFPVLHEATFLDTLENNMKSQSSIDRVWLCTLYCVLILGRRHTRSTDMHPPSENDEEDDDELWLWAQIEALLPTVLFTTSLASIQALLLASLHLHNTNSRDVCWTLTGAALRLGYAIGLHRPHLVDTDKTAAPPLLREMRKTIWWTLYAFEQLQVSSHDRPGAVRSRQLLPLQEKKRDGYRFAEHARRLILLLGRANAMPETIRINYGGPLAPAVALLRDLTRWHAALPPHLSVDARRQRPRRADCSNSVLIWLASACKTVTRLAQCAGG
ncbi:hypothetical protein SEUCBS140593_005980 [Sporothrix eucalyptigena]|uniref:Zn(2)-C6 fungal-type domain-containing protein n=1 Tax=Sporothrix eucalyptigena TaxID=1812306 RepID=A0ABP0C225_9PEZI